MSLSVSGHLSYQIANTPRRDFPYPHLYVESPFPRAFYDRLLALLPEDACYQEIAATGRVSSGSYPARHVIDFQRRGLSRLPPSQAVFWQALYDELTQPELLKLLFDKFDLHYHGPIRCSALLSRDRHGYAIGPHTDHVAKLITLLFYLPKDRRWSHLGTTLYRPVRPLADDERDQHHPPGSEGFQALYTVPYRPNTLLAFARRDDSFHGVEPITDPDVHRDVFIFNVLKHI